MADAARRPLRAAGALLLLAFCAIFYRDTPPPPSFSLALLALIAVAAVRPSVAIVLLSAFLPLASILVAISSARPEFTGDRCASAMVLAVLGGWAIRRVLIRSRVPPAAPLRWSATVLIVLVLASGVVAVAEYVAEVRGTLDAAPWIRSVRQLSLVSGPLWAATIAAVGILLMVAVADITEGNTAIEASAARAMVIGGAAAAMFNLLRIALLAAARDDALRTFVTLLQTLRVSVHYGDVNAAGSYFALTTVIALGLLVRHRRFGAIGAVVCGLGLWISGSRAGMLAAFIGTVVAMLAGARWDRRRRVQVAIGMTAAAALVAASATLWYPAGRSGPLADTMRMRRDNWTAALRMTAAKPAFGVGIGSYYARSREYGPWRENAHNNYLQILAELGLSGLAAFLAIVAVALRRGFRRLPGEPAWAVTCGLFAFLLSCLAGHPLLMPLVAYPFWMAVGLAAGGPAGRERSRVITLTAIAALLLILATLPARMSAAAREANRDNASVGLSMWQRDPDGSRLRWAGRRSAFYVPSSAHWVRIPLRHGGTVPGPLRVRIYVNDREADQAVIEPDGQWRAVRVIIARHTDGPYVQIRLEVEGTPEELLAAQPTDRSGVLAVGRPVVE